ncbi:ATP-binding cassette domain-containing protein [Micromonospora sp. BRA006-A]|nr:ATP-binding cassette domain-containing protein [Micromonospora sp. BRA006-A]
MDATELGRRGAVAPFSLRIHAGEVVGLAGLLGPADRGGAADLRRGPGRPRPGPARRWPGAGPQPDPGHRPGRRVLLENRRAGIVPELTVRENMILAMQAARGWLRPIPRRRQDELVRRYVEALSIRPANPELPVRNLSGGNQQKVLLARWLITEPRLLILDEPTRGIDVGAKAEIQKLVVQLSDGGMAVLFISAELERCCAWSHRVAVMRDREMVAQLDNDDTLDADRVMRTIASGTSREEVTP